MNLVIEDWTETTPDKIDAGEIAFGINYFPMELPKHLVQKRRAGRLCSGLPRDASAWWQTRIWMTFQSTRTRFTSSNIGMKRRSYRAYYSLFQLSQEFNCVPRTSALF